MPQTCQVWAEDADRSGAIANLAAVADVLFTVSGDNLRIREDLPLTAMIYFWAETTGQPLVQGRISAPTIANQPLRFHKGFAGTFANPNNVYDYRNSPLAVLRPGDDITCEAFETDEAGVAHTVACVLIQSNAPIPVGTPPQAITHIQRLTADGNTVAVGTGWQIRGLTQTTGEGLAEGDYLMWGAKVQSPTLIAARFIFRGMEPRPAVIPTNNEEDGIHPFSLFWGKGLPFHIPDGLPQIELLAQAAEAVDVIELYLTKVK